MPSLLDITMEFHRINFPVTALQESVLRWVRFRQEQDQALSENEVQSINELRAKIQIKKDQLQNALTWLQECLDQDWVQRGDAP